MVNWSLNSSTCKCDFVWQPGLWKHHDDEWIGLRSNCDEQDWCPKEGRRMEGRGDTKTYMRAYTHIKFPILFFQNCWRTHVWGHSGTFFHHLLDARTSLCPFWNLHIAWTHTCPAHVSSVYRLVWFILSLPRVYWGTYDKRLLVLFKGDQLEITLFKEFEMTLVRQIELMDLLANLHLLPSRDWSTVWVCYKNVPHH